MDLPGLSRIGFTFQNSVCLVQVTLGTVMGLLLIVDDDDLVRESVAAILANLGHDTLQAKDGLEAVQVFAARHREIHLVIMDVVMPNMDGIAATRAIMDAHPSAKIILMSGHSDQTIPPEAAAFLSKPFRSRTLGETVERILKRA